MEGQAMTTKTSNWDYRPYNGYPNWQVWNVSVWLSADEHFYHYIMSLIENHGLTIATEILSEELRGQSTPDGAPYSKAAIKYGLHALVD
jgi:hypothetical protein